MSLQNKNNQFLGSQDETNGSEDVVDIFDQYGSEDLPYDSNSMQNAAPASIVQDNVPSTVATNDVDDSGKEDNAISPSTTVHVTEKKWEAAYDGGRELDAMTEENTAETADAEKGIQQGSDHPLPIISTTEIASDEHSPLQKTMPPIKENVNTVIHNTSQHTKKEMSMVGQNKTPRQSFKIDPSKKTIAIVDDDIDTLDMYTSIFEAADYNVIRASDGLEALSVIGDHTPHIIFTGIIMPHMDGFAMMEALKQNKRTADIPVVINSHLGRESDRKRAEELGAKDFIVRGFTSPRETLERVSALLLRSEYTFHFDASDPEARKLVKDLGANNFFVCPRGQEMVLKLRIIDPKELTFSARFSCMDQKKDT